MQEHTYAKIGYGSGLVGFGQRSAVLVIDFMKAATQPGHAFSQSPLIMRALENTQTLLSVARKCSQPVANCNTAYKNEGEMPYWKVSTVVETYREGFSCVDIDPRVHDPEYDLTVTKRGASIFFETPLISYFIKKRVDTVIITGLCTSGCVRAACIDSFQYGFRTIIPEDCVGDFDKTAHKQNLDDVGRRYADIVTSRDVIDFFENLEQRHEAS